MTTKNGNPPYIREWIEQTYGAQMMKETAQLSKDQRETVKKMMSAKKFTNLVHGQPTRWNNLAELEKIAKEVMGDISFTRILFFHPTKEKQIVSAIFDGLAGWQASSV